MLIFKKGLRELCLDLVVAVFWMIYASGFLKRAWSGGGLLDVELMVFFTLVAFMFIARPPAGRSGAPWETALALVGTFLPALVPRAAPGGLRWLGESIQIISVAGMVAALACLGRSFGIAPADRGLRTRGIYRWVRHPLYAAEISFFIGYVVVNPSWRNLIAVIVDTAIQILRILREERILAGYTSYRRRVHWRLVPYVW